MFFILNDLQMKVKIIIVKREKKTYMNIYAVKLILTFEISLFIIRICNLFNFNR